MTTMSTRLRRVGREEDGAILVMALLITTVIALIVGVVLSRGDGALRTAVAMRSVTGTSYAADAAGQIAVNNLRTGYWDDDDKAATTPSTTVSDAWVKFDNKANDGCFGQNGTIAAPTPDHDLVLPNFFDGPGTDDQYSAYITCKAEPGTGLAGGNTVVNDRNRPGFALLALGAETSSSSPGIQLRSLYNSGSATCATPSGGQPSDTPMQLIGGVWTNGNLCNQGPVFITSGGVKAYACKNDTANNKVNVQAGFAKNCSAGTTNAVDPAWSSELPLTIPAEQTVPGTTATQPVPTSCPSATVITFTPGYYSNVQGLDYLTTKCNKTFWFKPGVYYFDFHQESGYDGGTDPLYTPCTGSECVSNNEWRISTGKLIGGSSVQPSATATIPGACQGPEETEDAGQGVQFVFGGTSRMRITSYDTSHQPQVELCGRYSASKPPIVFYGLTTNSGPTTTTKPVTTTTTTNLSGWTGASRAGLPTAIGSQTPAGMWKQYSAGNGGVPTNFSTTGSSTLTVDALRSSAVTYAAWRRLASDTTTGATTAAACGTAPTGNLRCTALPVSGFAPASAVPAGARLTGAQLVVSHREWRTSTGSGTDAMSTTRSPLQVAGLTIAGVAFGTQALSTRANLDEEAIDLSALSQWNQLKTAVAANGFNGGVTSTFISTLGRGQAAYLDSVRLELSYEVDSTTVQTVPIPYLRKLVVPVGSTCSGFPNQCQALIVDRTGSETADNPSDHNMKGSAYFKGTVYAPTAQARIGIPTANTKVALFGWGLVVRQLYLEWNKETGSAATVPALSPGWGVNSVVMQMGIYLCPGTQATCNASNGTLALKARVQTWDPDHDTTGLPDPTKRSVKILSWSHQR